VPLGFRW